MVAAAIAAGSAVASVAGSAISAGGAGSAAKAQQATSMAALAQQDATNAFNRSNTQPYINAGINGLARQQDQIDGFNSAIQPYQDAATAAVPGNMTEASLQATPGYQFTLAQGLQSTQNAAAARGLGVSGAALKGSAAYATGLSDQTYNTRFGQQQTQYTDAATNLTNALAVNNQGYTQNYNTALVGENAAVGSGTQGNAAALNSGNISTGLGNALAGSSIAQGNALASGVTGVANAAQTYNQQQQLQALIGNNSGSQYGSGIIQGGTGTNGVISTTDALSGGPTSNALLGY